MTQVTKYLYCVIKNGVYLLAFMRTANLFF